MERKRKQRKKLTGKGRSETRKEDGETKQGIKERRKENK
jgi:hypothetical protein